MDYKEIRELAGLMKEMGLTSLGYRNGSESIRLTRSPEGTAEAAHAPIGAGYSGRQVSDTEPSDMFIVKSPMVGVFYAAPGADEKPFVSVGDEVHLGDVLCIIETMKIMNEIAAEQDGVVSEIFVENKQVVEFGQPLFRIADKL